MNGHKANYKQGWDFLLELSSLMQLLPKAEGLAYSAISPGEKIVKKTQKVP